MELIIPHDHIISLLYLFDICNDVKYYIGYLYLSVKYKFLKSCKKLTFISTNIEEINSSNTFNNERTSKLFSIILDDNPNILNDYYANIYGDPLIDILNSRDMISSSYDIKNWLGAIIIIREFEKEEKISIQECLADILNGLNNSIAFVFAGNEKIMKQYIIKYEPELIMNQAIWFLDL